VTLSNQPLDYSKTPIDERKMICLLTSGNKFGNWAPLWVADGSTRVFNLFYAGTKPFLCSQKGKCPAYLSPRNLHCYIL